MYVISLSSIPPRFGDLPAVLSALLAQRDRPEAVQLWIPRRYRRFPDWDGTLPEVPRGVEMRRIDEDLGPATKVLFAAEALRGQALDLLYCDDDRIYGPNWASVLLADRPQHPNAALALQGFQMHHLGLPEQHEPAPRVRKGQGKRDPVYRLHLAWQRLRYGAANIPPLMKARPITYARSGWVDVAEGLSGVAIRPDFLDAEAMRIPEGLWTVDDVWLSGQMARRGVPVWLHATRRRVFADLPSQRGDDALHNQALEGMERAAANRACAEWMQRAYGIWGGTLQAGDRG